MLFSLKNASCGYTARLPVLEDVSFEVASGEVVCVLGANGVGKSTLFKSILRLMPLLGGASFFEGEDMEAWSIAKTAQTIGYVPQAAGLAFDFSAFDVVLMGRTSSVGAFGSPTEEDEDIALAAAARLGIEHLMARRFQELSGGEQQLAIIARALAQQPKMLVMDEPTAALDFGNQQLVLDQVIHLADEGLGIVMASHFPDHAFGYAHRALLIKDKGIYAVGPPEEVVTQEALSALYGVRAKIVGTGVPAPVSPDREVLTAISLGKDRRA